MKKRIFSGLLILLLAVGCASTKNNPQTDWRNNQYSKSENYTQNTNYPNGNQNYYYQPGDEHYTQNGYNYPAYYNEQFYKYGYRTNYDENQQYSNRNNSNYTENNQYINPSVDKGNRYPANDGIDKKRIEQWKKEGLVFAVRDAKGKFVTYGDLSIESWNEKNHTSRWVFRKANGQFVTGYTGTIEKFKPLKGDKEQYRLVIRNKKGEFVTWEPMDELISSRWEEVEGERADRYAIRYNGKWINWAEGKVEKWEGYGNVLVVRDTNDGQNNGKILTWIVHEKIGGAEQYRNPETGRFLRKAVQD